MLAFPSAVVDVDVGALLGRVAWLEGELAAAQSALEQVRSEKEAVERRAASLALDNEVKDRTILRLSREIDELKHSLFGQSSEKQEPIAGAPPATAGSSPQPSAPAASQAPVQPSTEPREAAPPSSSAPAPAPDAGSPSPAAAAEGGAPASDPGQEKPKKRGHGRSPLVGLRRRVVDIHPPPEQRICPCCGKPRRPMKGAEERSKRVHYVPASVEIVEQVRHKWSCPDCEEGGVAIGELPPSIIEKGRPTPAMLAHIITSKYADHLPLNRLEGMLKRHGLRVNRSTLAGWNRRAAFELRPIVAEMTRELLAGDLVRFDETALPVLDQEKPKGIFNGRMWAYRNGPGEVVFVYTSDKTHDTPRGPKELLAEYDGFLQADAAGIFDVLFESGERVEVGCNAHARRRVVKAKESEPEAASWALGIYQQLYRVEAEATAQGLTPHQRLLLRRERSAPLAAQLYAQYERWQAEKRFLPKSAMGEAVRYALNHRVALCRFLEDGRLPIDNNDTERALRAVAIGRRNYLFAGSEAGAMDAAVHYSLVVSCKELGIDPFVYLRDVLEKLPTHPARRVAELTPKGWKAAQEQEQQQATSRAPPDPD